MDGEKKNSFKILSTNDIRKHAQDWTLAGDVGLLAQLEQFSENICNKTQETQKYFNELLDNYDEVYTKIGNITNQFLALQNCQFVENRVYDEETPTEEKPEVKVEDEVEKEKLLLMHYKEAIEVGVKLLDTHFQEVQLPPNSDSDEDDEVSNGNNSLIWRPKNPYAGKKFPLLIGSAEWWADDNVGLGDYEENLDTERIMSESDSDLELPQDKRIQLSSSSSMENEKFTPKKPSHLDLSSEDLFGLNKNENFNNISPDFFPKNTNPLLEESQNFLPPFKKEVKGESENGEPSLKENQISEETNNTSQDESLTHKKVDNAFSRELAAKLASVNLKNDSISSKRDNLPPGKPQEKEIKYENATEKAKNLQKPTEKVSKGESLFDEGDDDDTSDIFSGTIKNISKGSKSLFFDAENDDQLFRGSNNLFFESDRNIFDNDSARSHVEDKQQSQDILTEDKTLEQKESVLPKRTLVSDLFGNLDDDDTLFASEPVESKQNNNKSLLEAEGKDGKKKLPGLIERDNKGSIGLFDSNDNEFEDYASDKLRFFDEKENKGEGFKTTSAGAITNKDSKLFFEEDSDIFSPVSNVRSIQNISDVARKPEDTLEPNSSAILQPKPRLTNDTVSSLFTTSVEKKSFAETDEAKDDLFSKGLKEDSPFEKQSKPLSFLDDDDDTSLFLDKPKQQDTVSVSSSRSSIFDDISVSKSRLASVFEKDKSNKMDDDLFNASDSSLFGSESLIKTEGNDLFSSKTRNKVNEKTSLFDDCDDTDDLFGLGKDKDDLFGESSLFTKSKPVEKRESLFKAEGDAKVAKESAQGLTPLPGKEEDLFSSDKKEFRDSANEIKESNESLKVKEKPQAVETEEDLFSSSKKQLEGGAKESPRSIKVKEKPLVGDTEENLFSDKQKAEGDTKVAKKTTQGLKVKEKPFLVDREEDLFNDVKKESKGSADAKKESTESLKVKEKSLEEGMDLFNEEKRDLGESTKKSDPAVKVVEKHKPTMEKKDLFKEVKRDLKSGVKELREEPEVDIFGSQTTKVKDILPKTDFVDDLDDDLFKSVPPSPFQAKTEKSIAKAGGAPAAATDKPKVSEKRYDIFENQSKPLKTASETLFDDLDDTELFKSEKKISDSNIVKPKPPSSLSLSKGDDMLEKGSTTKNIGKLNISDNLKNRLESIAKHSPLDVRVKPGKAADKVEKVEAVKKVEKVEEKTDDLDGTFEPSSNLLKCPNKDRVKVPVGRRPQSRRARQEAIRNSGIDFTLDMPETATSPTESSKSGGDSVLPQKDSAPAKTSPGPLFPSPVPSNPLSPSTDEEDYFNVPELDTNFEKEDQSIFKSNLFQSSNSSKIDENLLFDGAPVLSPLSPRKDTSSTKSDEKKNTKDDSLLSSPQTKAKKLNIFGEEDDEDLSDDDNSLFKTPKFSKQESKTNSLGIDNSNLFSQSKVENKTNKPLFDTFVDDGEDLFGETQSSATVTSKMLTEKVSKSTDKSVQSKEKGNPSFMDPLGLMSKDN